MIIPKRLHVLLQTKFSRNVFVLVGGTAFAQLIGLLSLPLLTRIYSPEDFTVLATYASILAIVTSIACLRFEIAIPIPKDQEGAINLFALSVISLVITTLLTWLIISLGAEWINEVTNQRLAGYLWLLPIGVFFGGSYSALQCWMTREKEFPLVAQTRITQSLSGAATQLGFGYAGFVPFGLLLGHLLKSGSGVFKLLKYFLSKHRKKVSEVSVVELKKTFKRYDHFPKYSTWEALTNSAAIEVPVLIIATSLLGPEAGFLMLAMQLLSAPIGLIGSSVSQVYLSEAAQKFHTGELKSFTNRTVIMLAKIGFIPLLIAGTTAPFIVPLIFGEQWVRTGILISWMSPWFFVQFITSPVSMALHITNNQRIAMILQIFGLILRGGLVWFAVKYYNGWVTEVYAISGFVFYLIYLVVIKVVISNSSLR